MEREEDSGLRALLPYVDKRIGKILGYAPVIFDRQEGYFIWEYGILHEVTFINGKTKDYISLFVSANEMEAEECYHSLLKRYSKKEI